MILNAFMMATPMMHAIGSWAIDGNETVQGVNDAAFWQRIARTLEDGDFDMVFFGDHMAPYDVYRGDAELSIEYGLQFPVNDPLAVIAFMASATERLGFGVTMSTAFYPPYLLARKMGTLDHLTRGRMAWNVVTSAQENEARNLGLGKMLPHDERYDRADEYMEVVRALWDSWDGDAIVADRGTGRFAHPKKVRPVTFKGKYFEVNAPSAVSRSPQGRPVVMQAGSSPRGRDFAAQHAEIIFAIKRTSEDMRKFESDMVERAQRFGRKRTDFKIIYGVQPIVGTTQAEAQQQRSELVGLVPVEAGLAKLSGLIGVDLSEYDLDAPMMDLTVPGAQGLLDIFTKTSRGGLTLRDVAVEYGASGGCVQVVGTGQQVADELEKLVDEGGADGFNLTPTHLPGAYEDFVACVVPALKSKGLVSRCKTGSTLRESIFAANKKG